MREETNRIDESHRKELLKFLLVKTAAVRQGIKPAELLRVRHCYSGVNSEGLRVCLYRSDIYCILGLDYVELNVQEDSSLAEPRNARWLARMGYPADTSMEGGTEVLQGMLAHLVNRAAECELPHEVGVFIGYPLKDVAGFMQRIPATPVHHGAWRVYGGADESLRRMRLYANAEANAAQVLDRSRGIEEFINAISARKAS